MYLLNMFSFSVNIDWLILFVFLLWQQSEKKHLVGRQNILKIFWLKLHVKWEQLNQQHESETEEQKEKQTIIDMCGLNGFCNEIRIHQKYILFHCFFCFCVFGAPAHICKAFLCLLCYFFILPSSCIILYDYAAMLLLNAFLFSTLLFQL